MGSAVLERSRPWRDVGAWQILIAVAGLVAGIGVAWVVSRAGGLKFNGSHLPFAVPVVVGVGWSFIGSGLLYWRSRPDNHLWAVLIFQGFAWFGSILPNAQNPVLFTFGQFVYPWQYASGLYLILSFPSGRLRAGSTACWWPSRSSSSPSAAWSGCCSPTRTA